jgi:secreted trypsin-like serine protease
LALVSVLVIGCTTQSTDRDDIEGARQVIVGGQATSSLPAVGALTRFGSTHCTGTLVEPRKVVTAAHCLEGVSASSLKFVIGPKISTPEHVISVASVSYHPSYNSSSLQNDIGYVTLSQDAPVEPMKLLPSMDGSWVGTQLIFVGYGASNGVNQTGYGTKRFVSMPIQQVWSKQFRYAVNGKNTCNGDSGGPAFAQVNGELLLAGVTSYGDPTCIQYGVDTRTDVYASFLDVTAPTTGDPCQGETFEGRCDGNTVVWCENASVQSQTCSSGKVCGLSETHNYYACIDPPPTDPCQGETFAGRCDGNTVVWCENEEVKTLACQSCGFDSQAGYYNCL